MTGRPEMADWTVRVSLVILLLTSLHRQTTTMVLAFAAERTARPRQLFSATNLSSRLLFVTRGMAASPRIAAPKPPTGREAFASATFNVDRYLQCRPRYPSHLYALLQDYISQGKSSPGGILCDLGCGPGFASFPLFATGRFDE